MLDYTVRHVLAHKDIAGVWSAETWLTVYGFTVRISSVKRPPSDSLVTNARCGRFIDGEFKSDPHRDMQLELRRVKIDKMTRNKCNLYHLAASSLTMGVIEKVTKFYGLS